MRAATGELTGATAGLLRRGLWLEYATLGWNVVGAVVVIGAAIVARSVALAGFGLDSLIEIFASVIVVWQLRNVGHDRERAALRLIGGALRAIGLPLALVLGLYSLIPHGPVLLLAPTGILIPLWLALVGRRLASRPDSGRPVQAGPAA